MKNWTVNDLPPVLWTVPLANPQRYGLGLHPVALDNYLGAIDDRLEVGAKALGTVREEKSRPNDFGITVSDLVSDKPLPLADVPAIIPFWNGRENIGGSHLARFDPLVMGPRLRALRRLRRRQNHPVILGTGFPDVRTINGHLDVHDAPDEVDYVADYLEDRFGLVIDDAMGRPETLGAIADEAKRAAGGNGIIMGETATLNNRARWNKSTGFDRDALMDSGIPWIIRAGTFGRSVLLAHGVECMHSDLCPIYLLVTGGDNVSDDEVARFRELGYDRFVLQGIGIGSPVAAAAREILRAWRETRAAVAPVGLGAGSEARRGNA